MPLLAVGGVKLPYNIVMLWVVASTVMLPYYLQVVNGRAYERCRERLHVFSQVRGVRSGERKSGDVSFGLRQWSLAKLRM